MESGGVVRAPSVRARMAAAVALTGGFYLVVLAAILGLLAVAVLPWIAWHHGSVWMTAAAGGIALSVASAARPRRARFEAPGALLRREDAPGLHEMVAAEAAAAGERPPDEIYATLEANAGVADVTRRHRVLIVGLPLLRMLSVREFQAVLAHEFGHYAGGDTKLGRWVAHTRAGIGRTITGLAEDDRWTATILRWLFELYGRAFLRITNAISRRQELAADVFAARRAGGDAQKAALRTIHAYAPAYDAYWHQDVAPVLEDRRRPPVTDGFARFSALDGVRAAAERGLERELEESRSDPYDSHPGLRERLAVVAGEPEGEADDSPCAITLVGDPAAAERAALDALLPAGASPLDPIEMVKGLRLVDAHIAPADAPAAALRVLAAGLVGALRGADWEVAAVPGEPVTCRRGEDRIVPDEVVARLADGSLEGSVWRGEAARLGIADLALDLR